MGLHLLTLSIYLRGELANYLLAGKSGRVKPHHRLNWPEALRQVAVAVASLVTALPHFVLQPTNRLCHLEDLILA